MLKIHSTRPCKFPACWPPCGLLFELTTQYIYRSYTKSSTTVCCSFVQHNSMIIDNIQIWKSSYGVWMCIVLFIGSNSNMPPFLHHTPLNVQVEFTVASVCCFREVSIPVIHVYIRINTKWNLQYGSSMKKMLDGSVDRPWLIHFLYHKRWHHLQQAGSWPCYRLIIYLPSAAVLSARSITNFQVQDQ